MRTQSKGRKQIFKEFSTLQDARMTLIFSVRLHVPRSNESEYASEANMNILTLIKLNLHRYV
jgi:hypothetical protein